MSLSVYIFKKETGFDISNLEKLIPCPHNDLFGFESTRLTLWGHPIMLTLGCNMIHSLKQQNIYALDEDVLILKSELTLIRENLTLISTKTGYNINFIDFRINNASEVVRIVEKNLAIVGVAIE